MAEKNQGKLQNRDKLTPKIKVQQYPVAPHFISKWKGVPWKKNQEDHTFERET